ncbi:hypothetical protein DFH11DRAFT_1246105 [Phellopilus nigrolimitatus]|nr:hypothetical protein DFH11DRAFT_1246105 [Phellopilus nigrolimitatus]
MRMIFLSAAPILVMATGAGALEAMAMLAVGQTEEALLVAVEDTPLTTTTETIVVMDLAAEGVVNSVVADKAITAAMTTDPTCLAHKLVGIGVGIGRAHQRRRKRVRIPLQGRGSVNSPLPLRRERRRR